MNFQIALGLSVVSLAHPLQFLTFPLELLFLSMELLVFLLLFCHLFNIDCSLPGPSCVDGLTNLEIPQILDGIFHSVVDVVFHTIVDGTLSVLDLLGLTEFSVQTFGRYVWPLEPLKLYSEHVLDEAGYLL